MLHSTSTLNVSLHDAVDLHHWLPDTTEQWQLYPYLPEGQPFRRNALLHARTTLTQFQWDAIHALSTTGTLGAHRIETVQAAVKGIESINSWVDGLPEYLKYNRTMPLPLYEFQYVASVDFG
jgi:hypothetical protein